MNVGDDVVEILGRREHLRHHRHLPDVVVLRILAARALRKVLELAYFLDMSHTEMAEHLNVPLGTVKGRVRAGLIKLRDLWSKKTR